MQLCTTVTLEVVVTAGIQMLGNLQGEHQVILLTQEVWLPAIVCWSSFLMSNYLLLATH